MPLEPARAAEQLAGERGMPSLAVAVADLSPRRQSVDVEVHPMSDRADQYRVRGGTRTLTTRLELDSDGVGQSL